MIHLLLAAALAVPLRAQAEHSAVEVLCAEGGHSTAKGVDEIRARLIAWVIDNRVYALSTTFGERRRRAALILDVLNAPHQWSHRCAVAYDALPAWLRRRARQLVEAKLHWGSRPDWLTRSVLYVIAEAEAKRFGARWGNRCLVKIEWGLGFYENCTAGAK